MRAKTLGLFMFSIFAVVLAMGVVSAAIVLNPNTQSLTVAQGDSGSFTFTIENTDMNNSIFSNFTVVASNFVSGSNTLTSSNIVFGTLPTSLAPGNTSSPVTVTVNVPSNQATGTYNGTITIDAEGSTTNPQAQQISITLTVTSTPLTHPPDQEIQTCTSNPGQLEVKSIDFNNNGFSGREYGSDDEWFLLDEIEVEIEIENDGDDDIDDISVEWGLWNVQRQEWAIDLDEEDEIDIKDGDEETLTVTFKLDDDLDLDIDELAGDTYRLYVVATGTVDDGSDTPTCDFGFEETEIIDESDFVVLDNIRIPEPVQCGASVEVTADVWNVGDNDQDEVSVFVTNSELGLREDILVGDVDAFDNSRLSFTLDVPRNAAEKTYAVTFEVFDEDNDLYENDFDDDPASFTIPLVVSGNCAGSEGAVSVAASLVSGGRAGDDLVVRATITNNLNELRTFTVGASDFSAWADSATADQTTLALGPGESRDVTFTLDVKGNAEGQQTFMIEVSSEGDVTRQPVSVNIEPRGFLGITGAAISGGALPWVIGLLNIILIAIIIVVAVRVARRSR